VARLASGVPVVGAERTPPTRALAGD
jgi:hypothetical protein